MHIFAKRGVSPNPYGLYHKKTENISEFFAERGGVLPIPKFPYQKKLGPPNCWKGAGGSQDFEVFLKKKQFFLLMPPLMVEVGVSKQGEF